MTDPSDLLVAPAAPVIGVLPRRTWTKPDGRRTLQLVLATMWLFDGVLQLQAVFFTKSFGLDMIRETASGNPSLIARPINWSGQAIGHHAVVTDAAFASIQLALGLGIAWRPTLKPALIASMVWAIGVWWIGEGLAGVLTGGANPVNGAPGAVIIYGVLAVLLWPSDRPGGPAPFIAARAVGAPMARAIWLVLWGSLAYFAVLGGHRSSQGLHDLIIGQTDGEPTWVGWIDRSAAGLVDHRGTEFMMALAVVFVVIAVGIYLPQASARVIVDMVVVINLVFWVVGQDFGELFTNMATDVNTAPLLILLALAYWPHPSQSVDVTRSAPALAPEGI